MSARWPIGLVIGGNVGELARQGGGLLALKFNRDDERDADLIGMEIAARAGYDPQAGITLWQKMAPGGEGRAADLAVDASLGRGPRAAHQGCPQGGDAALREGQGQQPTAGTGGGELGDVSRHVWQSHKLLTGRPAVREKPR